MTGQAILFGSTNHSPVKASAAEWTAFRFAPGNDPDGLPVGIGGHRRRELLERVHGVGTYGVEIRQVLTDLVPVPAPMIVDVEEEVRHPALPSRAES